MPVCARCGKENPPEARFCLACGTPLGAETVGPREERKVITVLYADLVGSTAAAERLDPEDVRARLGPYHERVRRELERFGATVEKFIGDAVVALFGAPVAHEDDPERAVRAALAIQEAIGELNDADPALELEVRIGVHTGEALVRLDADPRSGEGLASGDVMNTGARLQAAAPPGGILVGEATHRATRHAIEYRGADPVVAKGKAEPIAAWAALQARSRLGVDIRQAGPTPLVGRQRELDLLVAALERARAERETQLVTLVGVPGIGKSRLVFELLDRVNERPELVYWRQGRCLPYGDGVAFWALGEMVKAQAGILETDDEPTTEEKLRRALEHAVPADLEWVERHVRPLVGLSSRAGSVEEGPLETFGAWRRFFEGLADERPLVLVFEDLHCADDALLEFVEHLVDWARGVPVLVLCTARPELLERRSGWGGGKLNATTVALSPLSDNETARLVSTLAERRLMPADMQAELIERAGGNPLYAEQFVRALADRGPGAELPLTIQGLIAARLDALDPEDKTLLHDAAVVGKVFWAGALARIGHRDTREVEQRLHSLERKDFVRRERRSSVGDETEYAFRHILVRDVAYGQIPRAQRTDRHRGAAEWIESLSDRDDRVEMIAHHYSSALEFAKASGQEDAALVDRARRAFREAGDRSAAVQASAAASRFYASAIELWPPEDGELPGLLLARANHHVASHVGTGLELLVDARDALLETGDATSAAEAEIALASFFRDAGDGPRVREHVDRAQALVANQPASAVKAGVVCELGRSLFLDGRREEAIRVLSEALEMAQAAGTDDVTAEALALIGAARADLGDSAGIGEMERSIAIADAARLHRRSMMGKWLLGVRLNDLGELRRSHELMVEIRSTAERLGDRYWIAVVTSGLVEAEYLSGRWDEAMRILQSVVDAENPDTFWIMAARAWRALVRLARGDREGALAESAAYLEFNRAADDVRTLRGALALHGRTLAWTGRVGEGMVLLDEALERWRSGEPMPPGSPPIWLFDLQAALVEVGRVEELLPLLERERQSTPWLEASKLFARADFVAAADAYARLGALSEEAFARFQAARDLSAKGDRAGADIQLRKALTFYRSVGASLYVREGEKLLAASA